jgi:hypothetical protein
MAMASSLELISTRKSSERQQPQAAANRASEDVIRLWIARFAVNCGQTLSDARVLLWIDELSDIEPERLERAFRNVMRSHTFNSIPQVGEIRAQIDGAVESGTQQAAELEWQHVLDLRRRFWNPDMRGGFSRGMPTLSERVQQAARAAGVFGDFESVEALHVWGKKRFVESFITYSELEQDEFLLPDGEIKNLLSGFAQTKMLPSTSQDWSECRTRGEAYRTQLATQGIPDLTPEERLRVADELAAAARKVLEQRREYVVTVSDESREALRYQAELIKSRYPNEAVTDPARRRYLLEPECQSRAVDAQT